MKPIYPFKLLDSYSNSPEDQKIFFGRLDEINALYKMVSSSRLILIYGASGTGKTSLVQCGLATKMRPTDWFPIYVRRESNINRSLLGAIVDSSDLDLSVISALRNEAETEPVPASYYTTELLKKVYRSSYGSPIHLIFDQLEELLILGDEKEQQLFLNTVHNILESTVNVTLIFVVREEYLGLLYTIEKKLPNITQEKLRIEPMRRKKVEEILEKIVELDDNSTVKIKKDEIEEIVAIIFEKICEKDRSDIIQLTFLQLFLHRICEKLKKETGEEMVCITKEAVLNMEAFENIVRSYLKDQIEKITDEFQTKNIQIPEGWVLKILIHFVTNKGTKRPMSMADIEQKMTELEGSKSLIKDTLNALIEKRILRESSQATTYELAHDVLASLILEMRTDEQKRVAEIEEIVNFKLKHPVKEERILTATELARIEPYKENGNFTTAQLLLIEESEQKKEQKIVLLKKLAEEEKELRIKSEYNARRAKIFALVSLAFMIAASTLYLLSEIAKGKAKRATDKAIEINEKLISLRKTDSTKTVEIENYVEKLQKVEAAKINNEVDGILARMERLLERREIRTARVVFNEAITLLKQHPRNPYLQERLSALKFPE